MGLFSSDYKAYGSVSVNQIGTQRDLDDTFIADLIQRHPLNGRSMADEVRFDLFQGVSATYRKYNRISEKNNFKTLTSISGTGSSPELLVVQETHPTAESISGEWGQVEGIAQALATASSGGLKYSLSTTPSVIATVALFGGTVITTGKDVIKEYEGGNGNLFFDFSDGTVGHDTGIKIPTEKAGYLGVVSIPPLQDWTQEANRKFYFFSTDTRLNVPFSAKNPIEAYGCVSLQDNGNNENPYYELKAGHAEYDRRADTMDAIGVNFEEMSKAIFAPEPIPKYGTPEWDEDYGNLYNDSPELQKEYGSETKYYNTLVSDLKEMRDGIKNITDVHFGMFNTPKTLDVSNAYSLKAFFKEILPGLSSGKTIPPMGETTYGSAEFSIASGSLKVKHNIDSYTFGRRKGKPSDFTMDSVTMKVRNKGKVCWGVSVTDPVDPNADPYEEDYGAAGGFYQSFLEKGVGSIGIASVSAADTNGDSTYEFIEVFKPFAKHHIDVLHDGKHGTSQAVSVSGGLKGINDSSEPYSDVLIYPLTVNSVRCTPFFLRERLMRESTMLIIDGIQVVEVKWYQKGIFKIIFMIVIVVVSCYLTACAGTAAMSLTGATVAGVVEYALISVVAGMIISTIASMITDPALAALFVVVAAVLFGNFDASNLLQVASLAIEATGTYLQKKFTQEMLEMEEKMKELRKKYDKMNEEMDNIMEESGMSSNVNRDYALMKMTMPPPGEYPKDFFDRVLNKDLVIIDQNQGVAGKRYSKLPNIKN